MIGDFHVMSGGIPEDNGALEGCLGAPVSCRHGDTEV
jgi:hypothetical protein